MLTPAVLFALFLVFLALVWTLSLAESAFTYLSRRDAEDIVRRRPGSRVLDVTAERDSHLGALRVWRFVAEALSAVCLTAAADAVVDNTWFAVLIAAAVLTPTGDVVNLSLMAGPMLLCYELGVLAVWLIERNRAKDPNVGISPTGG